MRNFLSTAPYRYLFLFASLLLAPGTQATKTDSTLTPFKVSYSIKYSIAKGTSTLELSLGENGRYNIDSSTVAEGVAKLVLKDPVTEHAVFEIIDGAIQPVSYQLSDGSEANAKGENVDYNWDSAQASLRSEAGDETKPLSAGTMDQLVMQVAAVLAIKSGEKQFSFSLLNPGKDNRTYLYQYLADETIDTSMGELKTVRYSRTKEGSARTTHFWFSIEHDYVPIQLEQFKNDKSISKATLKSLQR